LPIGISSFETNTNNHAISVNKIFLIWNRPLFHNENKEGRFAAKGKEMRQMSCENERKCY
jgi:hypothetical protein